MTLFSFKERKHYVIYTCNNCRVASLKLTRIGNSVELVLPKETLARLKVDAGDMVFLTESPDGYRLTPYDPEFEQQMKAARSVIRRRKAALRELAK